MKVVSVVVDAGGFQSHCPESCPSCHWPESWPSCHWPLLSVVGDGVGLADVGTSTSTTTGSGLFSLPPWPWPWPSRPWSWDSSMSDPCLRRTKKACYSWSLWCLLLHFRTKKSNKKNLLTSRQALLHFLCQDTQHLFLVASLRTLILTFVGPTYHKLILSHLVISGKLIKTYPGSFHVLQKQHISSEDHCTAPSRTLTRCSWRWQGGRRSSAGCSSEFRTDTRTPGTSRARRRGTCRSPSGATSGYRFDKFVILFVPQLSGPGLWRTTWEACTRGRVGVHLTKLKHRLQLSDKHVVFYKKFFRV